MKKLFFVAALFAFAFVANAQDFPSKTIDGNLRVILGNYTTSGETQLAFVNNNTVSIYDSHLELVHSFELKGSYKKPYMLEFWDWDDNSLYEPRLLFSQTLFNDDDKYEYMVKKSDNEYVVVNENRKVLFTFEQYPVCMKIGNQIYFCYYNSDENNNISYTFFQLNKKSNSIEHVASVPDFKEQTFSVEGVQLNAPKRGVNLVRGKDGRVSKVYVK